MVYASIYCGSGRPRIDSELSKGDYEMLFKLEGQGDNLLFAMLDKGEVVTSSRP